MKLTLEKLPETSYTSLTSVYLRPITTEHLAVVQSLVKDKDYEDYFRRMPSIGLQGLDVTLQGHFSILDENGTLLGLCCFANADINSRKIEWGLLLVKGQEAKQNVMELTVKEMMSYIFGYLGYNKFSCLTMPYRTKLHAKLDSYGFTKEATLRQNLFWKGQYHDEVLYSITAQEARKLYPELF